MSVPKKIVVLDGHPDPESLCRSLGAAYERGALSAGAQVRRVVVADLSFDPILHHGFRKRMELEPDLLAAQEAIRWADHIVIVHPVWWSGVPALLKGFIDRIFIPGFGHQYRESGILWDKLLQGRSGHILYTNDAPNWYYRFIIGWPSVRALRDGTLKFCGVGPVRTTAIGPVRKTSPERRAGYIAKVESLGRRFR